MKFRRLITANLFRKKIRLILTIGSFAVALFLFGILAVVKGAFNQGVDVAGADRLVVINKIAIIQPLPLSYRDRILHIPGVTLVTHDNWFGGVYQDEKNFFPQFAVDVQTQREMFPEFKVPDDQWQAFVKDRQGAVVGAATAKKFGWKIGDRIPITTALYGGGGAWEFNLDGIYHGSRQEDDESQFWFQWDYFEERMPGGFKDMVGWYTVRIGNPDHAMQISKAIDREFANSPYETKTDAEKGFAASWVKQMGNIQFLILSIGGVVFFTLLLVTGNTMAIAVRERTAELAVLKAIGFSDRFVLLLVLVESLAISAVGGALGLLLAKLFTLAGDPTGGMLGIFYLPWKGIALGFAAALAVGIAAGILPAIGAMQLRVVNAMRRV